MEEHNRRLTFRKQERLCSRKSIELLFIEGQTLLSFPLRIVYIRKKNAGNLLPKVLISVPRKHLRKAVERNYVKRMLREAYRKNKYILIDYSVQQEEAIELALVYISGKMPESLALEKIIKDLFLRLIRVFKETNTGEDPHEETGEISVKSK